ncbi:nucleoside hydrolase [Opitutaceae bacterium]|nr:nucleoside hydrolase [Opitutaceae bacterium]
MKFRFLVSLLATPFVFGATPVVLSTDIAGDIDDTWALAHLLRSPELDLKMVLTETGEARYRASVAAKVLEVADRTDVEIALGLTAGVMPDKDRHQGPWVRDYDLDAYPGTVHEDGLQAFIDFVRASDETVTVIAIGPVPSLAAAIEHAPDIAAKCRLFGMHGAFDKGYGGGPPNDPEYNVRAAVPALRTVLDAGFQSIKLTPLDTCGIVNLSGENYQRIWRSVGDDALMRAVIENYCIWAPRVPWMNCDYFTQASSTLFDDVAVYMAYGDDFIEYETIRFHITDEGKTIRDPNGPHVADIAIDWEDLPGFRDWLTGRLLGEH